MDEMFRTPPSYIRRWLQALHRAELVPTPKHGGLRNISSKTNMLEETYISGSFCTHLVMEQSSLGGGGAISPPPAVIFWHHHRQAGSRGLARIQNSPHLQDLSSYEIHPQEKTNLNLAMYEQALLSRKPTLATCVSPWGYPVDEFVKRPPRLRFEAKIYFSVGRAMTMPGFSYIDRAPICRWFL